MSFLPRPMVPCDRGAHVAHTTSRSIGADDMRITRPCNISGRGDSPAVLAITSLRSLRDPPSDPAPARRCSRAPLVAQSRQFQVPVASRAPSAVTRCLREKRAEDVGHLGRPRQERKVTRVIEQM